MTTPSPHPNPDPNPNHRSVLPSPDPTVLTTEQMLRAVAGERDYVDGQVRVIEERLRAIDVATRLLNETVNRTPTDITKEITHLRELSEEKFESVEKQFIERDTRLANEALMNKTAVDAAFAAQKEAAAQQDLSNQKAIDKSERTTTETVKTNAELTRSQNEALKDRVATLELTVTALQSVKQGGRETISGIYAFIGIILTLLVIGGILTAVLAAKP